MDGFDEVLRKLERQTQSSDLEWLPAGVQANEDGLVNAYYFVAHVKGGFYRLYPKGLFKCSDRRTSRINGLSEDHIKRVGDMFDYVAGLHGLPIEAGQYGSLQAEKASEDNEEVA